MKRRFFLKYLGYTGINVLIFPVNSFSTFTETRNRIRNRFKGQVNLLPREERIVTTLPAGGDAISVETALNSRCTSDYDNSPELAHWGMFNVTETLSTGQIQKIASHIRIPRITDHRAEVRINDNRLTFVIDNTVDGAEKARLMIESGMQQQAVSLICAALGVGMMFKALGKNGNDLSNDDLATIEIRLDAMQPSFDGLYWNTKKPMGLKPWSKGNLPDPVRAGTFPLLRALSCLSAQSNGTGILTDALLGQILWAARGRTPHLYKSKAWGMTIPTSRGEQDNTAISVLEQGIISNYINWSGNRPDHSLKPALKISHDLSCRLQESFAFEKSCIIVTGKENSLKTYMEAGYQLLNILLQARALNLTYKTVLLDESEKKFSDNPQKKLVSKAGIKNPLVMVCL